MPVKVRRTGSRTASSTNLGPKMALATITAHHQPQQVDKEGEKHLKKRINSSQGLAQHQPRPFSRTGSQSKLHTKSAVKHLEQQVVATSDSQPGDDDDWMSSSSAVASPAPEPEDEEEDVAIYVNSNLNPRHGHHDSPPATPKRTNHPLTHRPNRRHHPHQVVSHTTEQSGVSPGRHPDNTVIERHQTATPAGAAAKIHFAGKLQDPDFRAHPQDSRIHHNGAIRHVSPPPGSTASPPANTSDPIQLSSSVIRVPGPLAPNKPANGTHSLAQRTECSQRVDENGNRRAPVKPQQEPMDEHSVRQLVATQSIRPAVPSNGGFTAHARDDIGGSSQRGFGALPAPVQHPFNDAPPQIPPSAYKSPPVPRHRPSTLRRDTTPNAIARSPMAVDTPPRSRTPPASMTHDEMVANNNKRHSAHSIGDHRRPLSLLQPSQRSKRHSLTSRPGSYYDYRHAHSPNNPLSLLVRLNPTQLSPLTAPPTVSTDVMHGDVDEASYVSMSPTISHSGGRSLRRKASAASLNSIATAPVVSTSSTMAVGSSASPTSALKTTSSAILTSLAHQPAKPLSTPTRPDSKPDLKRGDTLRVDDGPSFVSQFCSSLQSEPSPIGNHKAKPLGRVMAGREWTSHRTTMDHHGLLLESFSRLFNAQSGGIRVKR